MKNIDQALLAHISDDAEWFSQRHVVIEKNPRITLQTRGNAATMNGVAVDTLGNPETIKLGYSRRHRAILIRGCKAEEKGAYPLRHTTPGSTTRIFAIRAFAVANEIPVGTVTPLLGHAVDGVLIFPLDQEIEDETGHDEQRAV